LEYHCTQTGLFKDIWSLWIPFPTTQNHVLDVSSELGLLRSNGLGVMLHYDLDQGIQFGIAELNSQNPPIPKPVCSKTWGLWIPFPTTQNHVLDVSSEWGWLRSNGLGVMLHYDLDHGSNFGIAELNLWNTIQHPNRPAQRHGAYGSPSQPPKIMSWMYQVNGDG
jgi:hypothetical protein